MTELRRSAGYATLVIALAFAMHNLNALYIEPNYLGFEDPRVDYAKIDKLRNAMGSIPWTLSGIGHFLSGFAAVVLGLVCRQMFRDYKLAAGRLLLGAGLMAGAGFLLTGIADLMGGHAVRILIAQNPDLEGAAYMATSLQRIVFNGLAQVGLGWFAWQLSWCGLKTGMLPKAFCYFGYLSGFAGLLMGVIFLPVYLYLVFIWAAWLTIVLLRPAPAT